MSYNQYRLFFYYRYACLIETTVQKHIQKIIKKQWHALKEQTMYQFYCKGIVINNVTIMIITVKLRELIYYKICIIMKTKHGKSGCENSSLCMYVNG